MRSDSEDKDAPVELKTWTGFTRRPLPNLLNSPGSSKAMPIAVPDDSATGAGLDHVYILES